MVDRLSFRMNGLPQLHSGQNMANLAIILDIQHRAKKLGQSHIPFKRKNVTDLIVIMLSNVV